MLEVMRHKPGAGQLDAKRVPVIRKHKKKEGWDIKILMVSTVFVTIPDTIFGMLFIFSFGESYWLKSIMTGTQNLRPWTVRLLR